MRLLSPLLRGTFDCLGGVDGVVMDSDTKDVGTFADTERVDDGDGKVVAGRGEERSKIVLLIA